MDVLKCMLGVLLLLSCLFGLLLIFLSPNLDVRTTVRERLFGAARGPVEAAEALGNGVSFVDNMRDLDAKLARFAAGPTRILNFTDFRYLLQPECQDLNDDEPLGKSAQAVWIITSYAADVSKRSALRRAYDSQQLRKLGVRRVFLLGTLDEATQKRTGVSQAAIVDEAMRFEDILQGNFVEAYKNLTYKHLMGLMWAASECADNYHYIMKMDDDIIVNLYEAMNLLRSKASSSTDNFLMGYVMENMAPVRNEASKWFVTNEEFSGDKYPDFLSGWFYVTDMITAMQLIFQSKKHSNYFWIDDLFITGILREEIGIYNFIDIKDFFTSDYRFLKCCLQKETKKPKYKCDYIVGPDGGDPILLLNFTQYCEACYHKYKCISRPKEQLLKNTCVLGYEKYNLGLGNAEVKRI